MLCDPNTHAESTETQHSPVKIFTWRQTSFGPKIGRTCSPVVVDRFFQIFDHKLPIIFTHLDQKIPTRFKDLFLIQ